MSKYYLLNRGFGAIAATIALFHLAFAGAATAQTCGGWYSYFCFEQLDGPDYTDFCEPGQYVCSVRNCSNQGYCADITWNYCAGFICKDTPQLESHCSGTTNCCTYEVCDGLDNDCDGIADNGTESCDGVDNDCDGVIDDGCPCVYGNTQSCYTGPGGTGGVGACANGTQTCTGGGWGPCTGQVTPTSETCNGTDDDCNGQVDEGLGQTTCGVGPCEVTVSNCVGGQPQTCTPSSPGAETCNGEDDDCDGEADNLPPVSCGVGGCVREVPACKDGAPNECEAGEPAVEVCGGVDEDCDGSDNEGCEEPCTGQSCGPLPNNCTGTGSNMNCPSPGGACSPLLAGDPFRIAGGEGFFRSEDVRIDTGVTNIIFARTYVSTDVPWSYDHFLNRDGLVPLAAPFGRTADGTSLRWSHNFFTAVSEYDDVLLWRTPEGNSVRFERCTTVDCEARQSRGEAAARDRLFNRGGWYEVVRADGTRLVYTITSIDRPETFFLEAVSSRLGAPLYNLQYQEPECELLPSSPLVSRVEWSSGGLNFHYKLVGEECVLDFIESDSGGQNQTVATFEYSEPGYIAEALVTGRSNEAYDYSSGIYVERAGATVNQVHQNGTVTSEVNSRQDLVVTESSSSATCSNCCGGSLRTVSVTDSAVQRGDGTEGGTFTRAHEVVYNREQHAAPRVTEFTDSCHDGTATSQTMCSPGTERWAWACGEGQLPGHESAHQDKRGNWEIWERQPSTDGGFLELKRHARGAATATGTGLEETAFSYVYGANGQQLLASETWAATLGTGTTERRYTYDLSTNRLKSVITKGFTKTMTAESGVVNELKYLATFYFDAHSDDLANPDPYGRVLEVHGPCWAADFNAVDCAEAEFPITRFSYYGSSTTAPNGSDRLHSVTRYPEAGATGPNELTGLTTEYLAYDVEGHATEIRAPNNVLTTVSYVDGHPQQATTNGRVTTYAYEFGELTSVAQADGTFDVYCHRTDSLTAGCDPTKPWSEQLQWRAKASSATGQTWSERVRYDYWRDGTLKSETHEVTQAGSAAETLKVLKFAADAHRRPTKSTAGDGTGSFSTPRRYDGAANVVGIGNPYLNPPAFCDDGSGGISPACAVLGYDKADRLASMAARPTATTAGTPVQTCLKYDARGNVSRVGVCQTALTCEDFDTGYPTECRDAASEYVFDDFGNLVEAKLPNTGESGSGRMSRFFSYNARGLVIAKYSPTQVWNGESTSLTYDELGRQIKQSAISGGVETTLWTREYDETSLDSTCGVASNAKGRLAAEWNARGITVFAYDAFGSLTAEQRYRADPGTGACSETGADWRPSTEYQYDTSTGRLVSVSYPHGAVVTYGYYSAGGRQHRIKSVTIDGTLAIDNARWSDEGALLAYTIAAGSQSMSVEYLPGPASDWTISEQRPSSNDKTGRLRALWVSTGTAFGSGTGDVYRKTYVWSADQIAKISTQLLDADSSRVESFDTSATQHDGYDGLSRLLKANNSWQAQSQTILATQSFTYDPRGNRTSRAAGNGTETYTYPTGGQMKDLLTARSWGTAASMSYEYDFDGRLSRMAWPTGAPAQTWFNHIASSTVGADTSVYSSAEIDGVGVYTYYYDPETRRILKEGPDTGIFDEYFYGPNSNQLIEDRGNSWTSYDLPVDQYVWLGGRPVAVLRSKLSTAWSRTTPVGGDCGREDDGAKCGLYFIITDHSPKPVLIVNAAGKVSASLEYDAFGIPNRVEAWSSLASPYPANTNVIIGSMEQPVETDQQIDFRALFHWANVDSCTGSADKAWLVTDQGQLPLSTWYLTGRHGPVASPWHAMTEPSVGVRFQSNSYNCPSDSQCGCATGTQHPRAGPILKGFEYRRYQTGADYFSVPLRFPGQYHDSETDLFENWNRYYDPATGRYLQPEPLLATPEALVASRGQSLPTFAYALNNPVSMNDPTGFGPCPQGQYQVCSVGSFICSCKNNPDKPYGWCPAGQHSLKDLDGAPMDQLCVADCGPGEWEGRDGRCYTGQNWNIGGFKPPQPDIDHYANDSRSVCHGPEANDPHDCKKVHDQAMSECMEKAKGRVKIDELLRCLRDYKDKHGCSL